MNFSFKNYVLAICFLTLDKTYSLCDGDHDILSHNSELSVDVHCYPRAPKPDARWWFDFGTTGPFANMEVAGWCVDAERDLPCSGNHMVDVYSSYDNALPVGAVDKPLQLDQVNWLINHYPIDSTISIDSCYSGPIMQNNYQKAIWGLIENEGDNLAAMPCVYNHLIQEAINNGTGYEVSCDDPDAKIGLILVIDDVAGNIEHQVVMAEIDPHLVPGVCECTEQPTPAPTEAFFPGFPLGDPFGAQVAPSVSGDPHFQTWSGEMYEFHGICDLTLLKNPNFVNGLGMDVNVRAKKIHQFSYISTAVIRIGNEMFEVAGQQDGDTYWLNGKKGARDGVLEEMIIISGYPITFRQINSHKHEYIVDISEEESIVFSTWKNFVRVDVKGARRVSFHGSLGLLGSFDKNGAKLGRDGVTVFDDVNEFGMEWQVLASEDTLFHEVDGPQHPTLCEIPSQMALRRRLVESRITPEEAKLACSHVLNKERDLCIYDIMATNDKDVAGAY